MKKLLLSVLMTLTTTVLMAQSLPYQDPNLTAEQRADDLLERLTLDEKVKLMMDSSPAIPRLGIPQFQWWNEALHGVGRNGFATVFPITMASMAKTIKNYGRSVKERLLNISRAEKYSSQLLISRYFQERLLGYICQSWY